MKKTRVTGDFCGCHMHLPWQYSPTWPCSNMFWTCTMFETFKILFTLHMRSHLLVNLTIMKLFRNKDCGQCYLVFLVFSVNELTINILQCHKSCKIPWSEVTLVKLTNQTEIKGSLPSQPHLLCTNGKPNLHL